MQMSGEEEARGRSVRRTGARWRARTQGNKYKRHREPLADAQGMLKVHDRREYREELARRGDDAAREGRERAHGQEDELLPERADDAEGRHVEQQQRVRQHECQRLSQLAGHEQRRNQLRARPHVHAEHELQAVRSGGPIGPIVLSRTGQAVEQQRHQHQRQTQHLAHEIGVVGRNRSLSNIGVSCAMNSRALSSSVESKCCSATVGATRTALAGFNKKKPATPNARRLMQM